MNNPRNHRSNSEISGKRYIRSAKPSGFGLTDLAKSQLVALLLCLVAVGVLVNVRSVSALAFGNGSIIYPHQFFDVFGLSSVYVPYGHLYSGSGCVSGNLMYSQPSIFHGFQVYVVEFGGEPAGSYSVQVDGDSDGCVNFTILPLPTTTVTDTATVIEATTVAVTTTVTEFASSVIEYPYGLLILAILMLFGYAVTKRRTLPGS